MSDQTTTLHAIEEAAKDGRLIGTQCENGHRFAAPRERCPTCGSTSWTQVDLPATGKVLTYTIQNVAAEEFMNDTPFAWAIIELDDGTRTSGWVPWVSKTEDLPLGQAVAYDPGYVAGLRFKKV